MATHKASQSGEGRADMKFNYNKFKDLVHYICHMADRDELGAVKLNKILWYADMISYVNRGTPLTGSAYIKRQFGPVPREVLRALEELSDEGKMAVRDVPFFKNTKREFISLMEPDISRFKAQEIDLVANITHLICHHHTAESISELTHDIIWELAEIGEEIPYYAVYGAPLGEITEEDVKWAKESIAKNEAAYREAV
jgi:uncharacterized phage-associated protein